MSSELKLSLENFQSITSGELIFHKGLNFIIGQSNSGKSATFRAVKACLLNPAGKRSQKYIKKGSKQAKVTLEYNGNQIVWTRSAKESEYTINGEKFLKTGRSNAFQIMEDTGFVRDGSGVLRNIEEELQLPFPFDVNGIELFKLYENVFCVSDSSVILKSAKEQEDSTKKEIASIEVELNKNQIKHDELLKFEDEVDIEEMKSMKVSLVNLKNLVDNLKEGLDIIKKAVELDKVSLEVQEYSGEDLTKPLRDLYFIRKVTAQVKEAHALLQQVQSLAYTEASKVDSYEELLDIKATIETIEALENANVEVHEFESKLELFNEAKEVKRVVDTLVALKPLKVSEQTFINKCTSLKELKEYKESLASLFRKIKEKQALAKAEEEKVKQLEEGMAAFDVCPLCHAPLNKEKA